MNKNYQNRIVFDECKKQETPYQERTMIADEKKEISVENRVLIEDRSVLPEKSAEEKKLEKDVKKIMRFLEQINKNSF